MQLWSLGKKDPLEEGMATHSSNLARRIPWTEEPGRLQSTGSQRVGHDWATSLSLFLSCIGEGSGNPLQCSCLENPRDGGAWWAAIYGVAQSRTRLKRLSSSSSVVFIYVPGRKPLHVQIKIKKLNSFRGINWLHLQLKKERSIVHLTWPQFSH